MNCQSPSYCCSKYPWTLTNSIKTWRRYIKPPKGRVSLNSCRYGIFSMSTPRRFWRNLWERHSQRDKKHWIRLYTTCKSRSQELHLPARFVFYVWYWRKLLNYCFSRTQMMGVSISISKTQITLTPTLQNILNRRIKFPPAMKQNQRSHPLKIQRHTNLLCAWTLWFKSLALVMTFSLLLS